VLVRVETSEIPDDYVALGIEVSRERVRALSAEATARVGRLASGRASAVEILTRDFYRRPVLRDPSVIIPREYNYVLPPEAANFGARILWTEPFSVRSAPVLDGRG
jgi:hypothetical protein